MMKHTIANAPTPIPTSAPTGRPSEDFPVLVLVGNEVCVAGELVMLISPGLDVVTELKVVEAGMKAVLVNKCVLSHSSQAEVAKFPMARISVTGHCASRQGPTTLAIAPCPDAPQMHDV
jgi:hypothetical protein